MLNLLALQLPLTRYGFLGLRGFGGVILGIICMIILVVALWQVFTILARKLGWDADWVSIARILLTALIVIWFIQLIFGIFG